MRLFHSFHKNSSNVQIAHTSTTTLAPLKDPFLLPARVEDFKEWHIKILRRLNKHPVKEGFSGIITKEVDIPNFIPILQKLGLITLASYEDSLYCLKNDSLKKILKYYNLKSSGNKENLVSRILNNIPSSDVQCMKVYSDYYILTPLGAKIVNESEQRFKQIKQDFLKIAIEMILSQKLNDGYRMICKRNAEMPVPPGLGIDWNQEYYKGLDKSLINLYASNLTNSPNKFLMACSIFGHMSGDSLSDICAIVAEIYGKDICNLTDLFTQNAILSQDRNFLTYETAGILRYQFMATLDEKTCSLCGTLDGKIYYIKDKCMGVNCPPMHKGCRCTTVPIIDEKYLKGKKRSAVDPGTRTRTLVPRSMYWEEWNNTFNK